MAGILDEARGTFPGIGWPALCDGPAASVLALARQLEASQWLDPETIQSKQLEQLGKTAAWLAAHSPAFARRLEDAGLSAEDLATATGFAALPPHDRRWFRNSDDVDCDAVSPQHEPLGTNVTSGSTGEFIKVRRTIVNQLLWMAMVLREHGWLETDFTVPFTTVRAPNRGVQAFPDWGPPVSWLFDTGPALSMTTKMPGHEIFERIRNFATGHLVIYPNALGAMLDAVEARGVSLPALVQIRTVGERVDPELRHQARSVLGLELADAYTCQEAGYLALQCPETALYHVMSEGVILEVLGDDGTPCSEGEIGRVVITDLHNHATPIVRYALGDLAEVGERCSCGRGLTTLRRIVGRSRSLILLPDGNRVWPSLGGFGPEGYLSALPILQFQIFQVEPDLLEVHLVTARPFTREDETLIVERTCASLGFTYRLSFTYFEGRLPLPESGKFEDFVCLV